MPESSGVFRGIQFKVIVGFSLVLMAAIAAVVINFSALSRMSEAVSELSRPDPKMDRMRELMAYLTNEEVAARSYSLTGDMQYANLFHQLNDSVHLRLAQLKLLVRENEEQATIADTITKLSAEREALLDAFIDKRSESFAGNRATGARKVEVMKKLAPAEKTALNPPAIVDHRATVTTDSAEEYKPKGFFSFNWAKDIFKSKDKKKKKEGSDEEVVTRRIDSVTERPSLIDFDMIQPESEVQSVSVTGDSVNWSVEELVLLQRNKEVLDRIRHLVGSIEASESIVRANQAALARTKASSANRIISMITLIGLVGALVFIGLILRDIAISNRLRAQVEQERLRAEKLARAKQEFLANMSHEIRTPLNSIIGFAELLSKEKTETNREEFIAAIQKSSHHLLSLVNDILDFSKIEEGKFKVQEAPFFPAELMQEIQKNFEVRAAQKNICFEVRVDPHIPAPLMGDVMSVKQILINLVNNAIKFTEHGSVTVNVAMEQGKKNSCVVRMEVRDTGIGIPADVKDKLFSAFTQSSSDISRKYGGTGLGLAISKKLVEMLGGSIAVESAEAKGSVFTVSIPFAKAKALDEEIRDESGTGKHAVVQLRGKSILIADDEEMNIRLCEMILAKYGVQTTPAKNGREAVEKISKHHFDLVLMDLQMPEMSGMEAVKAVRAMKDESRRNIRVISLSANVFGSRMEEYATAGFTGELIKPFREEQLITLLIQHLVGTVPAQPANEKGVEGNNSDKPYSLQYLESTSGSDHQFIRGMLESFIHKTNDQMKAIHDSQGRGDMQNIREVAHKMIPAFRYLGISATEEKMRRLENLAAAGNPSNEISALIESIAADLKVVLPMLKEEIAKLHPETKETG
jgi:signal transduction histidine kinase/HPt (histidine-containing phosphotransfer) domain-containing protein